MKTLERHSSVLWWSAAALFLFCLALFILPIVLKKSYSSEDTATSTASTTSSVVTSEPSFVVTHVPTPSPMKAIYMTACVAGTSSWRADLENFINTTELNAIVIDIKDYSGTVSIEDTNLQANDADGCKVKDMREFVQELHEKNIYVIGRITVFQDPYYTKLHPELAIKSKSTGGLWKDTKGISYIDVGAKPYWDYVVKLAKASYALGFDEINFDYIRYPSDGNLSDMDHSWTVGTSTRADMLESFFSYLHSSLKADAQYSGMKTSADLFGLTTLAHDDMGIGQILERAMPYFDYIDPMVYPSHFADGTDGFANPAAHPYDIIKYSMSSAVEREQAFDIQNGIATSTPSKLRPWLQDFDLLGVPYGVPEVQAQMKATYDTGLTNWLFWDAGNKYTKDAFSPENN